MMRLKLTDADLLYQTLVVIITSTFNLWNKILNVYSCKLATVDNQGAVLLRKWEQRFKPAAMLHEMPYGECY